MGELALDYDTLKYILPLAEGLHSEQCGFFKWANDKLLYKIREAVYNKKEYLVITSWELLDAALWMYFINKDDFCFKKLKLILYLNCYESRVKLFEAECRLHNDR